MMHVLLDDGSLENKTSQNYTSAGYVIFVIMLEGQGSLTVELHKEQHESTNKLGTMLLDMHKLPTHRLCIYGVQFLFLVQLNRVTSSPSEATMDIPRKEKKLAELEPLRVQGAESV